MVWDLIMPVPLASIVITTFALMFDNFTGFAFLWLIPLAGLLHVCVYTRNLAGKQVARTLNDASRVGLTVLSILRLAAFSILRR